MASISRSALAAYRQALDKVCSGAGSATMKARDQWFSANPGASVAEIREAAIELTSGVLSAYGDAASSLACELFDSVMEAEGVAVPAAQVYDGFREGAVEGTLRRVVGDIDGTPESLYAFKQSVGQLAENETRRAASSTVEKNVERASKTKAGSKVRYARVPTKGVPCELCAMLASRGFVYSSAQRAEGASHHHCTCTIVPGIQGRTKVAGYDPDALRVRYAKFKEIDGREDLTSAEKRPFGAAKRRRLRPDWPAAHLFFPHADAKFGYNHKLVYAMNTHR